jgi:hypothetical protein
MTPGPMAEKATSGARSSWTRILTLELMLFFGLWLVYGMLITSKNIEEYGQSATEAIVDKHRFSVEKLTYWLVRGDVFEFEGHTYTNKNPGQAFISSIAYAHLRLLGISYARDKFFAGALVIFFSSSLLTAFAAVLLFRMARDLEGRRTIIWPLAAALGWALCTTQMAFSGVASHDVVASPLLVIAVYPLLKIRDTSLSPEMARNLSVLGGFLLGMTITTSMTSFLMVVVFGIYFLSLRRWTLLIPFVLGGLAGVAPLLLYNAINFGNPFTLPAVAYLDSNPAFPRDIYFFLEWRNFTLRFQQYYDLITWYAPVLWWGLAGFLLLPWRVHRERMFIIRAIAVLYFYLCNVEGLGICGYGPRYILAIMPFCSLGIVGLGRIPTKIGKLLIGAAFFWTAFIAFRINAVGAIGGSMYCPVTTFAYWEYVDKIYRGPLPQFPLLGLLLPFFVLWCVWAVYSQAASLRPESDPRDGRTA